MSILNLKTLKTTYKANALILSVIFSFAFMSSSEAFANSIDKSEIINLVNNDRLSLGVPAVKENELLSKAAQQKVEDMIENNYFAHTSPAGITPWHWIEKNDYDYKYAGENLAINFENSVDQQKAWMSSPTHRKNILNPKYQEIGVAVATGMINDNMVTISVQEFGTKMSQVSGMEIIKESDGIGLNSAPAEPAGFVKVNPEPLLVDWVIVISVIVGIVFKFVFDMIKRRIHRSMFVVRKIQIH